MLIYVKLSLIDWSKGRKQLLSTTSLFRMHSFYFLLAIMIIDSNEPIPKRESTSIQRIRLQENVGVPNKTSFQVNL